MALNDLLAQSSLKLYLLVEIGVTALQDTLVSIVTLTLMTAKITSVKMVLTAQMQ